MAPDASKAAMRLTARTHAFFAAITLLLNVEASGGGVTLDALGLYLTKNGYGGAQLIRVGNFYHLPINSNGKPANLIIDTGSPTTLIFRSSIKALGLSELRTNTQVSTVLGQSREFSGTATIKALTAGNCTFTNVPADVVPALSYSNHSGVLGLRELFRFGAVLDLSHQLIYFRPLRPRIETGDMARLMRTKTGWRPVASGGEVSQTVRSILTEQGWTPVAFSISRRHLRVPGAVNGVACYFSIDTGAYFTMLDADFAKRAKIGGVRTHISAQGFGKSVGDVSLSVFPSLRIGSYEVKRGSAMIGFLDPEAIGRGTDFEIAGLLGIEHLAINSGIFDFVSGTMYLRPPRR
jgi:predicted aspartyl protease